jgi:serine/threonine protein kinase
MHYAFTCPQNVYLVLDFCPGGDLFFYIQNLQRFKEEAARFYSAAILVALGHCHEHGVIYRE